MPETPTVQEAEGTVVNGVRTIMVIVDFDEDSQEAAGISPPPGPFTFMGD